MNGTDPLPRPLLRIGELDAGAVAGAGRGATATLPDGTCVSWWVGAEDRWHRPAVEASTRDRAVDGTPVLESAVRVPSGDAVGRVAVARVDGVPRPSVVFDVENASPIPVAFAWVIESPSPVHVDAGGVVVEGVGRLVLTRPALGFVCAADADALAAALAEDTPPSEPPAWGRPGAVALVVPLPHTAHAVATFTPGAVDDASVAALADREAVPTPDRVVAGWATHLGSGPRLDTDDPADAEALSSAVADVLLGPDPDDPALTFALVAQALGRLGRVDDIGPLHDAFAEQRANGSVEGDIGATIAAVEAVAAWWSGGATAAAIEEYVVRAAQAAEWLGKARRRSAVAAVGGDVARAFVGLAGVLQDLGEEAAADRLLERSELVGTATTPTTLTGVAASAIAVIEAVTGAATDRGSDLHVATSWRPALRGRSIEAHDVPTRWGHLSYGLRWHGARPALLWELLPHEGRTNAAAPVVRAPAIDVGWSSTTTTGEALLGAPDDEPTTVAVDPAEGGSFS